MKMQFTKNEFRQNVLTLMTGTTIAQAIPIGISPVLTRIYSPDDFGVFALYLSIAATLSVIATGRYELAIMLPSKNDDAAHLVILSFVISTVLSVFLMIVAVLLNERITELLGNPKISNWLYFVPLSVFITGVCQSLNYWFNRQRQYKQMSQSKIVQSTATASVNVAMGFGNSGAGGLVVAGLLGQGLAAALLAKIFIRQRPVFNKTRTIALGKKYRSFPLVNTLHAFLDESKNFLTTVLLVKLFGTYKLGQFYMVNKILLTPLTLIGGSISQILYRELSQKYAAKQDLSNLVLKIMIKLFLFALIPFFTIVLYGKELFVFVFGSTWIVAGEMSRFYALYVLFHFIASTLSIVPLVVNKQKEAFIWNLAYTGLFLISFVTGSVAFKNFNHILLLVSFVMSVYFIISYRWTYTISKVYKQL